MRDACREELHRRMEVMQAWKMKDEQHGKAAGEKETAHKAVTDKGELSIRK